MERVLFILPYDYMRIGGIRLPIEHYISLYISEGYIVDTLLVPYHFNFKCLSNIKTELREKKEPSVIILYSLNIAFSMRRVVREIFPTSQIVAYLADSMKLYANSVRKKTKNAKRIAILSLKSVLYGYKEAVCLKYFNKVIYVSNVDYEFINRVYKTIHSEVLCIPNCIDIPVNIPKITELDGNSIVFGCLTDFSHETIQDNLDELIDDIFPEIQKRLTNSKLIIAGKGAPEHLIKKIKSNPGITYLGYVKDLNDFYNQVHVVVTTVKKDCGIINRVLEAWAYKTLVMGYKNNFAAFIDAKNKCHFIEANSAIEFLTETQLLINNPEEYYSICNTCNSLVSTSYSWENRKQLILSVVNK